MAFLDLFTMCNILAPTYQITFLMCIFWNGVNFFKRFKEYFEPFQVIMLCSDAFDSFFSKTIDIM